MQSKRDSVKGYFLASRDMVWWPVCRSSHNILYLYQDVQNSLIKYFFKCHSISHSISRILSLSRIAANANMLTCC